MSKRKLPGGLAVAEATKITCTDSDAEETPHLPAVQIDSIGAKPEQVHVALQQANVQEAIGTPPRLVPKGSPAESFMQASPARIEDVCVLTCNLTLIPKDRWNKRRSMSAVVLAVLPIQSKSSTVRRNVVLRDERDECTVTVWGNHTNILNETAIGRPVTFQRVCLTEFEGKIQVAMPKDSSVSLGNTNQTIPIMHWLQQVGTTAVTVQQVHQQQHNSSNYNALTTPTGYCSARIDCSVHPRHLGKGCARNGTNEGLHPAPIDHYFNCGRTAQSISDYSILECSRRNGGIVRTTVAPSRERNQNPSCS